MLTKIKGIRFIHNVTTNEAPTKEIMGELNCAMELSSGKLYYKTSSGEIKSLASAFTYDSSTYVGRQVENNLSAEAGIIEVCNHAYNYKINNAPSGAEMVPHIDADVFAGSSFTARFETGAASIGENTILVKYAIPSGIDDYLAAFGVEVTKRIKATLPAPLAGTKYGPIRFRHYQVQGYPAMDTGPTLGAITNIGVAPTYKVPFGLKIESEDTPGAHFNGASDSFASYTCMVQYGIAYLEAYVEVLDSVTDEVMLGEQNNVLFTAMVNNSSWCNKRGYNSGYTVLQGATPQ